MNKKIAMILLPLQVCPGESSVSTLLLNLAIENEIYNAMNITIISKYDKEALEKSKKYNNTNFTYIKLTKLDQLLIYVYRIIKKVFRKKIFFLDRYYYKCYKVCQKENFDNIIVEAGQYKSYKKYAEKLGKEKMILHLHQEDYTKECNDIFSKVICVSDYLKKYLIKNFNLKPEQVLVVKNAINIEKFKQKINISEKNKLRKKIGLSPTEFVVLFCGRIFESKGVLELIKSFKNMPSDIKLLVIGDLKSSSKEYENKIKKESNLLSDKVINTGYVKNENMHKYYQIADIQAIPSTWEEPAGLVAIEGMISGLPIVATKSGGMIEYINKDCAIIIEKEQALIENLEKAILKLYQNEKLRKIMSKNGINTAKQFNTKQYYVDFKDAINKLNN